MVSDSPGERMLAVVVPVGKRRVRRRAMRGEVLELREVDRIDGAGDRGLGKNGNGSRGEEDGAEVKSHDAHPNPTGAGVRWRVERIRARFGP